jgi:hypothetical protein
MLSRHADSSPGYIANVESRKFDLEGKEQIYLSTPIINQSIQSNNPIAISCDVYRSCSFFSTLRNVESNDVGSGFATENSEKCVESLLDQIPSSASITTKTNPIRSPMSFALYRSIVILSPTLGSVESVPRYWRQIPTSHKFEILQFCGQ